MSQRPLPPLSRWLLQLFLPLWILAGVVLWGTLEGEAVRNPCRTGGAIVLFTFFGMQQCLFLLALVGSHLRPRRWAAMCGIGFFLPAMIFALTHHDGMAPPGGIWQETVFPTVFAVWIGACSCGVLIWSGTARYGVRARWAVPLSLGVVLLAFEVSLARSSLLHGLIIMYGFAVIAPALRDHLRDRPAPS